MMKTRIGIYAGTFDPLHEGHLSFALAAMQKAQLECVYFLPERVPRHKPQASPYETRVAILKQAVDRDGLKLLELPDYALTIQETLPELEAIFPHFVITLLVGADVLGHMSTWPGIDTLRNKYELTVGVRSGFDHATIQKLLRPLGFSGSSTFIVQTGQSDVSSSAIRSKSTPE